MFELGFFSPGKSKNRYLGIWYKKTSTGTVVWVANRDTPIADTSSAMLKMSRNGNLVILTGGDTMIWSSNMMASESVVHDYNPVAQLLDTGNLVVWENNSSTNKNLIWQSFDYAGDTFLPGMKFGKDLVKGLERYVTSWKSPDDPSTGSYSYMLDTNGYPQILVWHGEVLISRLGPWNGLGFSGFPHEKLSHIYNSEFVINDKEFYFKYELKVLVVQRRVLTWDGKTLILQWNERIKDWIEYGDLKVDSCDRFSLCGPYGICSISKYPPCTCLHGFEPRNPQEWDGTNWSSGCKRKKPLNCVDGNGDRFLKVARVIFPDTRSSWYNVSMTLLECEMACTRNCSCTAYGSLDIRNGGSGCLLWFDDLLDVSEYDVNQEIYIRMAASELQGHLVSQFGYSRRKWVIIILLLIPPFVLLLCVLAYANCKKKKRLGVKGKGYGNSSLQMEHFDDLQLFSLYKLAKATDNFSATNKIGEGGFGPVYKGVFEDEQEVAVKRLSKTSQQGLDEFKNEVICIAKLQHRNLVKLLGYCIHKYELILVYEYMTNKSLDSFLFGIARGILYLHQDSRLQIIHRDLKAANILLDNDMNPKISDFGLARKFVGHDSIAKTKKVVGTYGYISPEYAVHGRYSIKSDVFSFGVLVLEIVIGKKNRQFSHEDHTHNLLGHAWKLYKEDKSFELMSENLSDSCVVSEVLRSIHVALLCVQNHAEDRPTMLSVVLMLVSEGALSEPKQPAFFLEQRSSELKVLPSVDESTITILSAR